MTEYSYSFACPFCHGSWRFEEFATIAKDLFASFEGVGTCPVCRGTFTWVRPGTLQGKPWHEGRRHYKPHRCEHCGKRIEGSARRKYCCNSCRSLAWYYQHKVLTPGGVKKER